MDPPTGPYYRCNKVGLGEILKHVETQHAITRLVRTMHTITTRATLFLKMYLLHHKDAPPRVDDDFVHEIFRVLSHPDNRRNPQNDVTRERRRTLTEFYHRHFAPLLPAGDIPPDDAYMNTALAYAAKQIVTNFENNVKARYVEYVESYVNTYWGKEASIAWIRLTIPAGGEREAAIRAVTPTMDAWIKTGPSEPEAPNRWHDASYWP